VREACALGATHLRTQLPQLRGLLRVLGGGSGGGVRGEQESAKDA